MPDPSIRYTFGEYSVDPSSRRLLRAGVHVPLSTKAFDVLVCLVRRYAETVTKDELIRDVWPDVFVSEDSLTQNISALRRTLEDDPVQPRFIATVARRGYRFIAPVAIESPAEGAVDSPPTDVSSGAGGSRPEPHGTWRHQAWVAVASIAGFAAGAAAIWGTVDRRRTEPVRVHFVVDAPPDSTLVSGGVVSPDGKQIALLARDDSSGDTTLWVRTLSDGRLTAIADSEGALRPFWSPDSQSLAFFGGSRLRRASLAGGLPTLITETQQPRPAGGTWNDRDEILFGDAGGLYRVSARGGAPALVRAPRPERHELSVEWPQYLPDGRHVLYEVTSTDPGQSGIHIASLDGGEGTRLIAASGQQVAYALGHLLYVGDGRLNARRFDAAAMRFTGDERTIAELVPESASVSASADFVVAFGGSAVERLVWLDRGGRETGTVGASGPLRNLALSPDQQTLLAESVGLSGRAVWLIDVGRNVPTRLVNGIYPVWGPGGQDVIFSASRRPGHYGLYRRAIQGADDEEIFASARLPITNDITPDGRSVVYVVTAPGTRQDIWLLPLDAPRTPRLLLGSPAREIHAQLSPDGRWIAYASDEEGGVFQVYVQGFPRLGAKRRVSSSGGTQPEWRQDGRELFYLSADQTVTSVAVTPGPQLQLGTALPLFRLQLLGLMTDFRNQYTASADGTRFLAGTVAPDGLTEPITVLVNWLPDSD